MNENERFVIVTNTDDFTVQDTYKNKQITDIMELVKEANSLHESRMRLKAIRSEYENKNKLLLDAVHGLLAIQELRQRGFIYDTWER